MRRLASEERGQEDDREALKAQHEGRISFRERIKHFTWAWFSMTMSTGSLAVVLSMTPHTFPGLMIIGKVIFIIDLVAFCTFSAMICARFVLNPAALPKSLHHPVESLFFGTFWVSIALLLQCVQQYGVVCAGSWLVKTLEICFWLYVGLVFLVAIFQYHTLFIKERLQVPAMMPAWILPIYPMLVAGPLAGVLLASQPASTAPTILVGGIMLQGLGWCVAAFMYAIYIIRLMSSDLPEPSMRVGMYISVGPVSYTSLSLVILGNRAPEILPPDYLDITSIPVGDLLKALGTFTAMFLWPLGFWFFALSTLAVVSGAMTKRLSFNLTWWAFVFPNAGLTLAAIQIGETLQSPSIKGITSAMTIMLFVAWLGVAVANVRAVWQGKIMYPGKDEDMK